MQESNRNGVVLMKISKITSLNVKPTNKKIEKAKSLLKIKNEYHDIIGHRLALFSKYLENDTKDIKSILF